MIHHEIFSAIKVAASGIKWSNQFEYVSAPAFLVAIVLHMFFGMIWYNPKVFGKAFVRLAHGGRMHEPDQAAMRAAIFGTLISMPFFSFLLGVLRCRTAGEGSLWGFTFGVFFDGGINMAHSFFEDRPFALFLLHRGYHIVSLTVVGAVLGAMCGGSLASV